MRPHEIAERPQQLLDDRAHRILELRLRTAGPFGKMEQVTVRMLVEMYCVAWIVTYVEPLKVERQVFSGGRHDRWHSGED